MHAVLRNGAVLHRDETTDAATVGSAVAAGHELDGANEVGVDDGAITAVVIEARNADALHEDLRVLPGDPAPTQLDPDRLGQIVANLVENALKYATSIVEVSTGLRDRDLAVVVTDDGPGIPPDDMNKVFMRLYTVRATPGRTVGTGLGLAIVQEIAAAMGGRATADAPATGGARITVSLPASVG